MTTTAVAPETGLWYGPVVLEDLAENVDSLSYAARGAVLLHAALHARPQPGTSQKAQKALAKWRTEVSDCLSFLRPGQVDAAPGEPDDEYAPHTVQESESDMWFSDATLHRLRAGNAAVEAAAKRAHAVQQRWASGEDVPVGELTLAQECCVVTGNIIQAVFHALSQPDATK